MLVKRSQTVSCILYKVTEVASSVTTHQFILYSVLGLKSYFPPRCSLILALQITLKLFFVGDCVAQGVLVGARIDALSRGTSNSRLEYWECECRD